MLTQQQHALLHTQRMQILQITREREMELLRNQYSQVLIMATLLMYPSYESCINFHMPGADVGEDVGTKSQVNIIHVTGMATCMILSTYCVLVTTMAIVWGPEMIISGARGGDDMEHIATVINRGVAAMRMAKYHIYGSLFLTMGLLCVFFVTGTSHRIGFWERKGVSGGGHTAAVVVVCFLMLAGYAASLAGLVNCKRIFSLDNLNGDRLRFPSLPCSVCGSRARHGLLQPDRRLLRCWAGKGESFKCYQCMGVRSDFMPSAEQKRAALEMAGEDDAGVGQGLRDWVMAEPPDADDDANPAGLRLEGAFQQAQTGKFTA
eukprot:TRINITY_DN16953_c0_g1_i1.p1 TRINITY_DN16953_c0_g1~~TRINITY_DN16953_c0_g1_i1.p1  ORF type:complete len:320 (+),score=84.27 TRINITY_DN16953_c0_g1_i1:54-1013(+)